MRENGDPDGDSVLFNAFDDFEVGGDEAPLIKKENSVVVAAKPPRKPLWARWDGNKVKSRVWLGYRVLRDLASWTNLALTIVIFVGVLAAAKFLTQAEKEIDDLKAQFEEIQGTVDKIENTVVSGLSNILMDLAQDSVQFTTQNAAALTPEEVVQHLHTVNTVVHLIGSGIEGFNYVSQPLYGTQSGNWGRLDIHVNGRCHSCDLNELGYGGSCFILSDNVLCDSLAIIEDGATIVAHDEVTVRTPTYSGRVIYGRGRFVRG